MKDLQPNYTFIDNFLFVFMNYLLIFFSRPHNDKLTPLVNLVDKWGLSPHLATGKTLLAWTKNPMCNHVFIS
jgi:hypothetical protein